MAVLSWLSSSSEAVVGQSQRRQRRPCSNGG
jgi:hypothetical protein